MLRFMKCKMKYKESERSVREKEREICNTREATTARNNKLLIGLLLSLIIKSHESSRTASTGATKARKYMKKALEFGVESGYLIPSDPTYKVLRVSSDLMKSDSRRRNKISTCDGTVSQEVDNTRDTPGRLEDLQVQEQRRRRRGRRRRGRRRRSRSDSRRRRRSRRGRRRRRRRSRTRSRSRSRSRGGRRASR